MFSFRELTEDDISMLSYRHPDVVGEPEERREALMKKLSVNLRSGTLSVDDACFLMPLEMAKETLKGNKRRTPSDESDIRFLLLEVLTEKQHQSTSLSDRIKDKEAPPPRSTSSLENAPPQDSRALSETDIVSNPSDRWNWLFVSFKALRKATVRLLQRAFVYFAIIAIPSTVLYVGVTVYNLGPCRECKRRNFTVTYQVPLSMLDKQEQKELEMNTCSFHQFECHSCHCTYVVKHPKEGQKSCSSCGGFTLGQTVYNGEQVEECQFCGLEQPLNYSLEGPN